MYIEQHCNYAAKNINFCLEGNPDTSSWSIVGYMANLQRDFIKNPEQYYLEIEINEP